MGAQVIPMVAYDATRSRMASSAPTVPVPSAAVGEKPVPTPDSATREPFVPLFQRPAVQAWMRERLQHVLPILVGLSVLLMVWSFAASGSTYLPGPGKTFDSAVALFSDPFYQHGPNDQGIGWNVYSSLKRVAMGFGLAAMVGIPFGFILGRFVFMNRAASPIISILRPVSPLAWLPIGLAVFKAADPAAIFAIFVCSIWPMIINTALGVASVPQDYLNVARVLKLSEWKVFTKILLPACVPYVLTGAKLSLGIAWLVIVASEMLTGGTGIGFWVWDEWNNLNMEHIIVAIVVIGVVGLLLETGISRIADRFDYRKH